MMQVLPTVKTAEICKLDFKFSFIQLSHPSILYHLIPTPGGGGSWSLSQLTLGKSVHPVH